MKTGDDFIELFASAQNDATALEDLNCSDLVRDGDREESDGSIEEQLSAVARVRESWLLVGRTKALFCFCFAVIKRACCVRSNSLTHTRIEKFFK